MENVFGNKILIASEDSNSVSRFVSMKNNSVRFDDKLKKYNERKFENEGILKKNKSVIEDRKLKNLLLLDPSMSTLSE